MSYLNFIKTKSVTGYRISRRQQFNWFWTRFRFLPLISNTPFFYFHSYFACCLLTSLSFPSTFPSPKFDVNSLPLASSSGFCALSAPALLSWFPCWTQSSVLQCRTADHLHPYFFSDRWRMADQFYQDSKKVPSKSGIICKFVVNSSSLRAGRLLCC